jgi:hypothetical protein
MTKFPTIFPERQACDDVRARNQPFKADCSQA